MAEPPEQPRFAAYLRISKDPDGTSDAPDRQLADLHRFAELKGWHIAEVFEDRDLSAFRRDVVRPSYEALLDALAAGEFDGVLVWRLDRLVRRTVEFSRFWTVCDGAGATLASATQPIDTSDPVGMLVVHILVAFAEMESATTSTRLKAKEAHLARAGHHKEGGRRAYGMRPGWREVEPAEAEVIREIAERLLAGEGVTSIVRDLNERGVPSATGGAWTRRSVVVLMRQARLFGKREHHGDIVADGDWPAILDEATGMRLRAMIDARATGMADRRQHLLSGLLVCSKCGHPMKGAKVARRAGADETPAEAEARRKYVCPSKVEGGCGGTSVVAAPVEELVVAALMYRLDSRDLGQVLKARTRQQPDDADLLAELAELQARADELAEMWAAGELTRSAMLAAQRKLDERQTAASERLASMHEVEPIEALLASKDGVAAAWDELSVSRQRAVLAALLERVDVLPARGGGRFKAERLVPVWRV